MEAGQMWRQYIIAGIANIGIATTGFNMGWTSPINIILKAENGTESPLPRPITLDEESWIGSLLTVGAILGPFIAGFLAAKLGRRWGLLVTIVPQMIGWILIAAATNVALLYAGRIFWGVAVGMFFTITPMYCAEIASDDARGALGSFLQVFVTFGFLAVYVIGPYISYSATAYFGVAFTAVFAFAFFFMPETPIYFLSKNDRESAAESLMKIRGKSRRAVEAELDKMAADVAAAYGKTATLSDVFKGNNFKALYISSALMLFQQFCGINAVLFYMTNIFEAAGSDLDSSLATIIIGTVQFAASCVTPIVVDRLGRRILLLVSSCGTAIGLALLGMYFALDHFNEEVAANIGFVPILSLVLFIITYCWGLGPLPWAVLGELMPIEVKAVASPLCTAFCWTLSFLVTRFFGPVANAIGMYSVFWIFGGFCIISFFFTLFIVPETKGKSFQEIQDLLAGRTKKSEKP